MIFREAILHLFLSVVFCRSSMEDGTASVTTCTRQGYYCSHDCRQVVFCGTSSASSKVVTECRNKLCDPSTMQCTASSCGKNPELVCRGSDVIPDPFNCSSSYFCLSANEPPVFQCQCPFGTYYESKTGDCVEGDCARESVVCPTTVLQPWKYDPRFYYHCTDSVKVMVAKCPLNWTFTGDKGCSKSFAISIPSNRTGKSYEKICRYFTSTVVPQDKDTETSTVEYELSKDEDLHKVTLPPPIPSKDDSCMTHSTLRCSEAGTMMPDRDCKYFWVCRTDGTLQRMKCALGTFNISHKGCVTHGEPCQS